MLKIAIDPGHGMSNRRWGVYDPGAVAVSALAGFDQEPTRWTTSLVASLAGAAVWAATRWRMHRTRCVLEDLTKVGGTD